MAMGRIITEEETERQGYAAISFFSAVVGKGLFRMVALPFCLRGFGGQIRIGFQFVLLRADKERFVAAQVGAFGDGEHVRAKRGRCAEQKKKPPRSLWSSDACFVLQVVFRTARPVRAALLYKTHDFRSGKLNFKPRTGGIGRQGALGASPFH
jgi:hypothetical protein